MFGRAMNESWRTAVTGCKTSVSQRTPIPQQVCCGKRCTSQAGIVLGLWVLRVLFMGVIYGCLFMIPVCVAGWNLAHLVASFHRDQHSPHRACFCPVHACFGTQDAS